MPLTLKESDYQIISVQEEIGIAELKAIKEVESGGKGHLEDGRPKILFEGHRFYQNLRKVSVIMAERACKVSPSICYKLWTNDYYQNGSGEWKRLAAAIEYNREAALKSASWGAFQILGENYKLCGYDTIQDFVNAMYGSERHHLEAVCNFIKAHPTMYKALIARDWETFARYYNGPSYKQNNYHVKLKNAFNRYHKLEA